MYFFYTFEKNIVTNQTVRVFISYYISVSCYEAGTDLKQFTLQNKRLKTALACVSNTEKRHTKEKIK